jgi:sigma-E factor negative regulatory protein RseA
MKERLSAAMDGELDGPECERCLDRLRDDPDLRETWGLYHLVGDAIRGHAGTGLPAAFSARLSAEPTVFAPRRSIAAPQRARWYALAAAASLAAVALVGWMALPVVQPPPLMASAPAAPVATAQAQAPTAPVAVPEAVNDYLLAHQRFSPSSVMGGMAPYIRTVAETTGAR